MQIPNHSPQCSVVCSLFFHTRRPILESYWPGPFYGKSFPVPLPSRRLSPHAARATKKARRVPRLQTPGSRGAALQAALCSQTALFWIRGFLSGLAWTLPLPNKICPQCTQPFHGLKGSQNPDIQGLPGSELQHQCVCLLNARRSLLPDFDPRCFQLFLFC